MGAAAVRAAEAIGYAGAGTVEFIVDGSRGLRPDGFWFMEMNTRLQVEHPVTEAVTGVDLVEWQLRVASGERLWVGQEDVPLRGHAFEARLYAEDVLKGFLPATGRLSHLSFPDGVRADSGVRAGDTISPFYDPMIAKIIVEGPTRGAALAKLRAALAGTEVAGSVTNLAFLRRLANHQGFAAGDVDTGLIARDLAVLAAEPVADTRVVALAALGALGLHEPGGAAEGFHLWTPLVRTVRMTRADEDVVARVTELGRGAFEVQVGEVVHHLERGWRIGGERVPAKVVVHGAGVSVFWEDGFHFEVPDPLARGGAAGAASGVVEAPMPGLVKAVFATAGEAVVAGQRLAILEAMKMEHTLTAARDGVVAEVLVAAGAQVEAGAAIVRLEDEG
jgi:3-methylcrotonyl-CoA carboxylase alpha subunit